ncbi:MAG: amidohydrolase family protein [Methylovulum sp.]|nr:amidohydrolase family protein [Methylovulum sp.]
MDNKRQGTFWGLALLACHAVATPAWSAGNCKLLTADRVFDGYNVQTNAAVLIKGQKVAQVGTQAELAGSCGNVVGMGDATILPGFIESHAHISFQNVLKDKVLQHGVTTVQDTGGPLLAPQSGSGQLRLLSVGPIIQAPGGYPLNIFGGSSGYDQIGYTVASVDEAQGVVQHLVDGGATAIKIALEPGGETGAPWMMSHGGNAVPPTPWDILPLPIVSAIVDEAHHPHDGRPVRRVIAHAGENIGFERSLLAGVDEFAHIPCAPIDANLLTQAANTAGLTFVSTVDTLSSCVDSNTHLGIHANTAQLAAKIADCETNTPGNCAQILYGSEIGHDNVPWGINGEEMHYMLLLTSGASIDFTDVLNVFRAATSKAGAHLGIDKLGTLTAKAPADVIAVRGNPFVRFKLLEYPDFVMSGGKTVVNTFK